MRRTQCCKACSWAHHEDAVEWDPIEWIQQSHLTKIDASEMAASTYEDAAIGARDREDPRAVLS
ncbi:hypothetical protein WOLCODRAFT_147884 [Wolfiporia cocos MD-104 SS10]|uniref:Uncharacterized protein n=1 Tax=Wolfiporia cocos (strain MD-104) TaxID=742152 RepID=A0A2H3IV07_WOLCO|nr:hypothetical protein WOLCODRAFT_147884 [Wolfiporia cocos MD-104 SS10]